MNQPHLLSKQEVLDYASRYVAAEDAVDFAHNGDLFCLLARKIESGKVQAGDEGWGFQGYGICTGYTVDEQEIPAGKWLWMHFASFATFPPSAQAFRLQPPHAVKGGFQNPQRTEELKIVKINAQGAAAPLPAKSTDAAKTDTPRPGGKVLAFRKKPAKKRGNSTPRQV
jgi:hypothetical protein